MEVTRPRALADGEATSDGRRRYIAEQCDKSSFSGEATRTCGSSQSSIQPKQESKQANKASAVKRKQEQKIKSTNRQEKRKKNSDEIQWRDKERNEVKPQIGICTLRENMKSDTAADDR